MNKIVRILGIRGLPASHGGFETFAEFFARHLERNGWKVIVYCQESGSGPISESIWKGIRRVHIPVNQGETLGSVIFDGRAAWHASKEPGLVLTLGYNTAFFNVIFRFKGITNLMNMDGIEWKRSKWSRPIRFWFWVNELIGCKVANRLIADHPAMKIHLARHAPEEKISMVAYGAEIINAADSRLLEIYDLQPGKFSTIIARSEPENSILEMVRAFSAKPRGSKLVVLGNYKKTGTAYQREVLQSASNEVVFPGPIYNKSVVSALRLYSLLYLHGHTVGGTNPSLLEALGAGNPVLAHDNRFNRWVAGDGARYFSNAAECSAQLDRLLGPNAGEELQAMSYASRARHKEAFRWKDILAQHEAILLEELR